MNNIVNREWTCLEKKLLITTSFLLGMVIGFICAPIKKGFYCGNHNGNHYYPDSAE